MIIVETVDIKPSSNSFYYREKGYIFNKKSDIISVYIKDLQKNSTMLVTAKCYYCSNIKNVTYGSYILNTKDHTINFSCSQKCSSQKRKDSNLLKYGVEYVSQLNEVKEKRKETNIERYGVEYATQSDIIKQRIKDNNLEKYGVEHTSLVKEIKDKFIESNKKTFELKGDEIIQKRKKTNLEKYGVENALQCDLFINKMKTTNLEKYGTEYTFQSEIIKEKIKEANIEKYGVEYGMQSQEIRDKVKSTNIEKYGVENGMQSQEIKDKVKSTNIKKLGVEYPTQSEIVKEKVRNTFNINTFKKYEVLVDNKEYKLLSYKAETFNIKHILCEKDFIINKFNFYDRNRLGVCLCTECYPISENSSIKEIEIRNFIESFGIETIKDKTILDGKELDIYIPSHNLALEFNGLYYHIEKEDKIGKITHGKDYHLDKSLKCQEKDIHLMHIWEDEWVFKQEIVKSIILNKLNKIENKIFARKCVVKEVKDSKLVRQFLDTNHIQGYSQSSIKLGLYYNDELVSLMTFGYRHTNSKKEFELIRFCNILKTNVVGASSKLFKYFLNNYQYETILSYSDFRLFDGKMYKTLGFEKIHLSKPDYFWCKNLERKHRFTFNKQKLIKDGYDPNKTEDVIMYERGYSKLWSCGQVRWEYKKYI